MLSKIYIQYIFDVTQDTYPVHMCHLLGKTCDHM